MYLRKEEVRSYFMLCQTNMKDGEEASNCFMRSKVIREASRDRCTASSGKVGRGIRPA